MLLTLLLVTALVAQLSTASAVVKRIVTPVVDDGIVLNFALTIGYLQLAFYRDVLSQFGSQDFLTAGFPTQFYGNLLGIYSDELEHITFLNDALLAVSGTPTVELEYNFPVIDVQSSVALASVFAGFVTST